MKVHVTGKQENQRGNELKIPDVVTIKVSEHMCVKLRQLLKTCAEHWFEKIEYL